MNPNPDPYVMYLVVKKSLGMGAGKLAGQVGHAVHRLVEDYYMLMSRADTGRPLIVNRDGEAFRAWCSEDRPAYAKIVLGASNGEFEVVKALSVRSHTVVDRGFTTLEAGTETVVGLWPMRKSEAPEIVRSLRLLK